MWKLDKACMASCKCLLIYQYIKPRVLNPCLAAVVLVLPISLGYSITVSRCMIKSLAGLTWSLIATIGCSDSDYGSSRNGSPFLMASMGYRTTPRINAMPLRIQLSIQG